MILASKEYEEVFAKELLHRIVSERENEIKHQEREDEINRQEREDEINCQEREDELEKLEDRSLDVEDLAEKLDDYENARQEPNNRSGYDKGNSFQKSDTRFNCRRVGHFARFYRDKKDGRGKTEGKVAELKMPGGNLRLLHVNKMRECKARVQTVGVVYDNEFGEIYEMPTVPAAEKNDGLLT
ncbi:hypothetical protein TNIN_417411 [Trichonephila inaurata madagascariensis]|uniref:Uncharacterized protein n=1 Tax=Trichonephila inaurata madagascariensis TaxID=2747483 RepID=A0A8X6XEB1_9ARAC|nr:hypothetical protein TNIN_417411 [Trichonephila inaurata madagascariensis]